METKLKHVNGQCPDSPEFKYRKLREVAKRYNCNCLVEFGSYQGDCALFLEKDFQKIITIEPVKEYYDLSKEKLKKLGNLEIHNKKSLDFIKNDLDKIQDYTTLFWLDSHVQPPYQKNASNDLFTEVKNIFNSYSGKYVLLIDDYRLWSKFCHINDLISLLEKNSSELVETSDMVLAVPKSFRA